MSSKWPLSAEGLLSTKCWACSFLCILVFHSQPPYMACATFIKLTPQKGTEAHRGQIRHIQEVTMMGFKPRQLWVGIHILHHCTVSIMAASHVNHHPGSRSTFRVHRLPKAPPSRGGLRGTGFHLLAHMRFVLELLCANRVSSIPCRCPTPTSLKKGATPLLPGINTGQAKALVPDERPFIRPQSGPLPTPGYLIKRCTSKYILLF